MEPQSFDEVIDVLEKSQKRIQGQIRLADPSAMPLYDTAWGSVWHGLRALAGNRRPDTDNGDRMQTTLFTIRGGFNICDDFLRSGCLELASQAFTMTLAFCLPDELQHKMNRGLEASGVKIPDTGLGTGKTQIKKQL